MTGQSLNITAEEFLDAVFAEIDETTEKVCITEAFPKRSDPTAVWFDSYLETDRKYRKWDPKKQARAMYTIVSTVTGELNAEKTMVSRKRDNLVRVHLLVLDDIGSGGKTGEPPVEPSYKLETSPNSFHFGYFLIPDDRIALFEAVVEAIHQQGFGDKGAGGSYRAVRIPGSANKKPGRNDFRSVIQEWHPDRVWTLDELALAFGLDVAALSAGSKKPNRTIGSAVTGLDTAGIIDPLLVWLIENGHVINDGGGDWVDVRCPNHAEHTAGGDHGGYSPLGRGSDEWAQTRAWSCLHGHCSGHKFKDFIKAMGALGAPRVSGHDPLPWLQSRYAYIGMGARVADLQQRKRGGKRWIWDLEDWGKMHKGRIMVPGRDTPVEMKTAFLEHKNTKKVIDTQYWPVRFDEDVSIINFNGQELVNSYVPPNHPYTNKDPDVFLDHIEFLLPDPAECALFLDWLAYKIQNPACRSYACVMIAEDGFGVGRSWLRAMLEAVLQGHISNATLPQLIGKGTASENNYNDWAAYCQFLIIEEAKDNMTKEDFYHGYETFKKNVDTRVCPVRVNPKFGRISDEFMFFNALIFSNHSDAMAMPHNDRRVCVLTNPSVMQTPEYYDRLEGSLNAGEPGRVFWYLMERDISGYSPIYPPMTKGKSLMTEQNALPSDEIKNHILEHCEGDIFTKKMLKSRIISAASALDYDHILSSPGGVVRTLWGKMGALRDDKRGARYYLGGEQVEVRAIREKTYWMKNDAERAKELFEEEILKNDKTGGAGLRLMGKMG